MGRIIGIDLGTTNSLVAYWENGESHLIPNALGEYLTPSVVNIDKKGNVYVGKVAKERQVTDPDRTISVFKRSMGSARFYRIGRTQYLAEELSAMVLKTLKEDAERYLGEPVEEAIISVPAYFSDIARKATRKAGKLAGLKVDRIINEPSAAALACQYLNKQEDSQILVFDFGGGTLDVSLVECMDDLIEIVAVSGNNHLGGYDFDEVIAREFCKENHLSFVDLTKGQKELILRNAEKVKRELSFMNESVMHVMFDGEEKEMTISRKKLIQISGEIFQKISAPIKRVLADGDVMPEELSAVVLVGGSCKMPIVQQYLKFMLKNVKLVVSDPDHMVALGIGVYAGIKERNQDIKDMILTDICPFSLGIQTVNKAEQENPYMAVLIPRNSSLPSSHEDWFVTIADNQTKLRVAVYQGEDMYAKNNLFLGEMMIDIPPAPKGEEGMYVRFTYDINGLLVIDVRVPSTGKTKQMVFVNGVSVEVDEEIRQQLSKMEHLRIAPKEEEENRLILERSETLYVQLTGNAKKMLEERIKAFHWILETGTTMKRKKAARGLMDFMDMLEQKYYTKIEIDDKMAEFEKWFDTLENSEEDEEIEDWGKLYYTS